jgi:hypothetical protein
MATRAIIQAAFDRRDDSKLPVEISFDRLVCQGGLRPGGPACQLVEPMPGCCGKIECQPGCARHLSSPWVSEAQAAVYFKATG